MIERLGMAMGSLFLIGGILGFVPGVIKDGMYLGIFMVNTPHNILHIASGLIFLIGSLFSEALTLWWFRIFGLFYASISVAGLAIGDGKISGLISNNMFDAYGHAALALIMLSIGFAVPRKVLAAQNSSIHD